MKASSRVLVEDHQADIAEHFRHLMHGAFVRGEPDVRLDLFLFLESADVV
jgi:hypothetical protein